MNYVVSKKSTSEIFPPSAEQWASVIIFNGIEKNNGFDAHQNTAC
jgi:hypothetical protein